MPLPFKVHLQLPDNRNLALVRLKHLKRRLKRDPKFKNDYVGMECHGRCPSRWWCRESWQPTRNGKCVVHPTSGCLLPQKAWKNQSGLWLLCKALSKMIICWWDQILNGLIGVPWRFRKHSIPIMCDIEKMFHRFHVSKDDRDFLRFLWWENGDTNSEYCMRVKIYLVQHHLQVDDLKDLIS